MPSYDGSTQQIKHRGDDVVVVTDLLGESREPARKVDEAVRARRHQLLQPIIELNSTC